MSVYDHREKPVNQPVYNFDPQHAKNRYILDWWTTEHDQILRRQIEGMYWVWSDNINTREIIDFTNEIVIDKWRNIDPVCKTYAWYNVLLYFAGARAIELGYNKIKPPRTPKRKKCPLCNHEFMEDSLPGTLVKRLGIDHLDFCSPCLRDIVFPETGNNYASSKKIKKYLLDLSNVLGRVPTQGFGEGEKDYVDLNFDERYKIFQVLKDKPTTRRVKKVFGSWLHALIQAGVLADGSRKTSRGIQTIATDGHVCLSLGEKTIDEYLYSCGIQHEKEPRYPEGNYRADFKVGEIFIEYFGLKGNPEYDAKTKEKIQLCKKYNIILIAIYPDDLIVKEKFVGKLSVLFDRRIEEK